MILSILLAAIVTNVAPDGVNTIITDTETGCSQSTLAYVWPRGGCDIMHPVIFDKPETVINGDQRIIVMSESYWHDLTNKVESCARYTRIAMSDAEKTEEGRVKFHGKRVRTSQNLEGEEPSVTYFYEDGWHYTNRLTPRRSKNPVGTEVKPAEKSLNPKYDAIKKRRAEVKMKKPIEFADVHFGGEE